MLLILGGAGAVAGAFNYRRDCRGYRSTYRQDWITEYDYCTTINGRHVHTEDTPWDISLARPALLWGGVGAIAVGTLLSTVWSDVPIARDLNVQVSPGRVAVGRSFGF